MIEPSNLQVVLMGMITVFLCLIILIFMITIMSKAINGFFTKSEAGIAIQEEKKDQPDKAENQRIIAAISAAIAENLNKDVSQIRIHSIKRL